MDTGAHFYKCDFQVHTPRDNRWGGKSAVSDEERKEYAEELIQACRDKGINAIAITDHHDFTFFPFIKDAAKNELDDAGKPVNKTKQIIVFPGLELTLSSPPSQAILLLDTDFPTEFLSNVLTTLAINPLAKEESKAAEVIPIPRDVADCYEELYIILNNLEPCRNKFIILPNVSEGGQHTLLRTGFADFYKNMPCVGGYLDGSISQYGDGNSRITSGQDRNYGFKKIAIFQTSDNRYRDHRDLGKVSTWVKWSIPTAEAIRQACLASESRLSQTEPNLPVVWIKSINVSNSKFMGPIDLEFNQQYNAVIGGRGTGKSTILEYLRWGLCDQPIGISENEDIDNLQSKRVNLIKNTLEKFHGEVRITFIMNEIMHLVKRNSISDDIFLKIGDGDFEQVAESDIQNLLPIQAYSQKQLSSVGIRLDELKRFIEQPILQELDKIKFSISDLRKKIISTYNQLTRKREIDNQLKKHDFESSSLNSQVVSLRKNLKGISENDQIVIDQKPLYEIEESYMATSSEEFEIVINEIEEFRNALTGIPEEFDPEIESPNYEIMNDINSFKKKKFEEVNNTISNLKTIFADKNMSKYSEYLSKWENKKKSFDKKYEVAKSNTTSHQRFIDEIKKIETRLNEIKSLTKEQTKLVRELNGIEDNYLNLKSKWNSLHTEKLELLQNECDNFNSISNGLIRSDLSQGIDVNQIKKKLSNAFSGMRIKETKVDNICDILSNSNDPIKTWEDLLQELEKLILVENESSNIDFPDTPILESCKLIDSEKTRIIDNFNFESWIELSTTELEFTPSFYYCTNINLKDYIPFSDASAGQQATALLTVLLNQKGVPLIIDQPEDDVDNRVMEEITALIWTAKMNRQLIFSSHNANMVVNGDSELVVCCDYRKAGDQSGGRIMATGAIDISDIKEEITSVMEGGEKAFKLRKEKYGF